LAALKIQLEAHGFEVCTCMDAYSALAQSRKNQPDVLLLDIKMPAGDGFSVLERIAKIPEHGDLQVICITGDQSAELDLRAQQMGAYGLVHKPIVLSTLVRLIDTAAHKKSRLQAIGENARACSGVGL
jgi:CheY-like chemotaxis protein